VSKLSKLGIIAGDGYLPLKVANAYQCAESIYIAKLNADNLEKYHSYYNTKEFSLGAVGSILEYFRINKVSDIVMCGGLKRPDFAKLKVDRTGAALLYRIVKTKFLGDDKLLRVVADFIEEMGFKIIAATEILKNATIPIGVVTNRSPNATELQDIRLGVVEARKLGVMDYGQAVIVERSNILGLEEQSGTDMLLQSCATKCNGSAILVKMMKPIQDERLDIPTIGEETIRNAAKAGLVGIAVEAGKVIVIDREKVINMANELGIFIIGI